MARKNYWFKKILFTNNNKTMKSVKSLNRCKSVIQIIYDILKMHGGKLKVSSYPTTASLFIIQLSVN